MIQYGCPISEIFQILVQELCLSRLMLKSSLFSLFDFSSITLFVLSDQFFMLGCVYKRLHLMILLNVCLNSVKIAFDYGIKP